MKRMKFSNLAVCLILVLPMLAGADTPATQPSAVAPPMPAPSGGEGGPYRPRFAARGIGALANRAEWDEMMDFLRTNSPIRAKVLADTDAYDSPRRFAILKRWRDYKFVAERFPEIADLRVQRFQTEDAIFGLELQARRDPQSLESLRPQVRTSAAKMVQLSIEERQRRIEKMEMLLQQEQQKLAGDQSNENQLIDQRTDRIMMRMAHAAGRDAATTQPAQEPQSVQPPTPAAPQQ